MKIWYLSFITNWYLFPKLDLCTSKMTWDWATCSILSHSQIPSVLYVNYYLCYVPYSHYDPGYVLPLPYWVVVKILQPCHFVCLDCLSKMNLLHYLLQYCIWWIYIVMKMFKVSFSLKVVYNRYKCHLKTTSVGRFPLAWWLTHCIWSICLVMKMYKVSFSL